MLATLVAVLALLVCAPIAGATVFTVNTTADHFDQTCDGDCTIRDALNAATAGTDSVSVPAGVYTLNPALGPLVLDGDTLNGAGARATILDGALQTRVIDANISDLGSVVPQLAGVTVQRGNGTNPANASDSNGDGGGIYVTFGSLGVSNSHIANNSAAAAGGGIGAESGADITLVGSAVFSNTAGSEGGGLWNANEGLIIVANSTITGNVVTNGSGGGVAGGGGTNGFFLNATVAGNSATSVGGINTDGRSLSNTIVAGNSGGQCAPSSSASSNNSIASDGTCALAGTGDQSSVDPALGPRADNGGPTNTRAIGPTSAATNHGGTNCQTTDQRGVTRPQGGACDVGAFEYRPPRLTVVKRVTNDDGGTLEPGDFTIHVRVGSADVGGSPQPGSATGNTYAFLAPGTYALGEDANSLYAAAFSGDCTASGAVTLAEGSVKTCVITNNDKPPTVRKSFNAEPERGTIKVKLPGKGFRRLREGEQLPMGTIVDARKGRVGITAAANKKGGLAHAIFYDGVFKLGQTKGKKPITELTLTEKLTGCKAKGKASIAKKKVKKRRLWGDGKGRFRTKGKHSAATVIGTKWYVEDRCTSTLTKVARGKVSVRDFVKKKTVLVKKGHRYIARAD